MNTEEDSLSKIDLASACLEGDYDHAKQLLATGSDPITSRAGYFNWSPLHYSARQGNLQFADLLISQYGCSPQVEDKEGRTPLHIACQYGQLEFARYLIQQKRCDANYLDIEDQTPLHHTCGWLSECSEERALTVSRFLIERAKCDASGRDVNGKSSVLHACEKGFISVLKYFVEERDCDLTVVDYKGNNALHLAVSFSNNFDVVNYIVNQKVLDLTSANNRGNNILHMAAIANSSMDIVKFILSQDGSSSLIQVLNDDNLTPFDIPNRELSRYILTHFQVHNEKLYEKYAASLGIKLSPTPQLRIFVLGDMKSGKTTLINSLHKEGSSFSSSFSLSFSSQSPTRLTFEDVRGMIVTHFESKLYGQVTYYDFSGHSDYDCIQQAILERSIHPVFSIFLVVVDQSKPSQEMQASLHRWLDFLSQSWDSASEKAKVIVVGSHADLVKSSSKMTRNRLKSNALEITESASSKFEVVLKVHIDSQKPESSGINSLRKQLVTLSGKMEVKSALSFNACCLLMLLKSKFSSSQAITLDMLLADVEQYKVENNSISDVRFFLSDDVAILARLLDSLDKARHICFCKGDVDLRQSTILIEASEYFSDLTKLWKRDRYSNILDDRNLIQLPSIMSVFPDQDLDSIMRVFSELKVCVPLHLQMDGYPVDSLYIPSLLSCSAPKYTWDTRCSYEFNFGWIIKPRNDEQSFTLTLIHAVLKQFLSAASGLIEKLESISLWKNGLYLRVSNNEDIIEILLECGENRKSLFLLMRAQKFHNFCLKFRSSMTKVVRQCILDSCCDFEVVEYLMDPFDTIRYPLPSTANLTLFSISDITTSIRAGDSVVKSTEGISMPLSEIAYFEPFAFLNFSLLSGLKLDECVSDDFLKAFHDGLVKDNRSYHCITSVLSINSSDNSADKLYSSLLSWKDEGNRTYSNLISSFQDFSFLVSDNLLPKLLL